MVVASDAFSKLADQMAEELRIPEARIAVVSHPIGGSSDETLVAWADAAIDELIGRLG